MRRGETGQNIRSGCCLGAAGVGCRRLLCFLSLVRSLVPPRVSLSLSLKTPFPPATVVALVLRRQQGGAPQLQDSAWAPLNLALVLVLSFLLCSVQGLCPSKPKDDDDDDDGSGGWDSLSLSRSLKPPYRLALAVEM